jgi:nitrous oxide reductase
MSGELNELQKRRLNRRWMIDGMGAAAAVQAGGAILGADGAPVAAQNDDIIEQRELSSDDVTAALETYMSSGKTDHTGGDATSPIASPTAAPGRQGHGSNGRRREA